MSSPSYFHRPWRQCNKICSKVEFLFGVGAKFLPSLPPSLTGSLLTYTLGIFQTNFYVFYRKYENLCDIEIYSVLVDEFICPKEETHTDEERGEEADEELDDNEDEDDKNIISDLCGESGKLAKSRFVVTSSVAPSAQRHSDAQVLAEAEPKSAAHTVAHVCVLCSDDFERRSSLVEHLRTTHRVISAETDSGNQPLRLPSGKFQCPLCDKEFCRKLNASQHLITHVSQKNVECDQCPFKCYTQSQLDVHRMKHAKRFRCELCDKMFAYKFQLETHVQAVHYNMRPFPCEICGKTFKTRYNYSSHMAQHRDVRNFQCPFCPHRCRKSYDLRIHIRTHTGEKPFQCSYCGRCYSQNGDRLKHERICNSKAKTKMATTVAQVLTERNEIPPPDSKT